MLAALLAVTEQLDLMILDLEVTFIGNLLLKILQKILRKLGDLAAAQANQVMMLMLAGIEI